MKAIAGAGKSVIAATIAAEMAQVESVPVLFFLLRQILAKNHDRRFLARDWMVMLL